MGSEIPFDIVLSVQSADSLRLNEGILREWIKEAPVHDLSGQPIRVAHPRALYCFLIKSDDLYSPYDAQEVFRLHPFDTFDDYNFTAEEAAKSAEMLSRVEAIAMAQEIK